METVWIQKWHKVKENGSKAYVGYSIHRRRGSVDDFRIRYNQKSNDGYLVAEGLPYTASMKINFNLYKNRGLFRGTLPKPIETNNSMVG